MSDQEKDKKKNQEEESSKKAELPFLDDAHDRSAMETQPLEALKGELKSAQLPPMLSGMKPPSQGTSDRSAMETQPMKAFQDELKSAQLPPKIVLPGMQLPSLGESQRATQPMKAFRLDTNEKPDLPFLDSPHDLSGMDTESLEAVSAQEIEKLKRKEGHFIPITVYFTRDQIEFLRDLAGKIPTPEISMDSILRVCAELLESARWLRFNFASEEELLNYLKEHLSTKR